MTTAAPVSCGDPGDPGAADDDRTAAVVVDVSQHRFDTRRAVEALRASDSAAESLWAARRARAARSV